MIGLLVGTPYFATSVLGTINPGWVSGVPPKSPFVMLEHDWLGLMHRDLNPALRMSSRESYLSAPQRLLLPMLRLGPP